MENAAGRVATCILLAENEIIVFGSLNVAVKRGGSIMGVAMA